MIALQQDRWILWLPPAMVAGAAGWLVAPSDPVWWLGALLFLGGCVAIVALTAWPSAEPVGLAVTIRRIIAGGFALIAAAGLGAVAAQARTASVMAAPFIGGDQPVLVEGWVVSNEASNGGQRLRLLVRGIEGASTPPRYVRVSVPAAGLLTPGRAARCRAVLGPASGPLAPGAYDFARRAFFERLGATGFSYGRCRPIDLPAPTGWLDRQRLQIAAMRADLSAIIQEAAPDRGGAIASAFNRRHEFGR